MSKAQLEKLSEDLFLTFRCCCTRKDVHCIDIILQDQDVSKAIADYASYTAIENIVIGASTHHGIMRKFRADTPGILSKIAPDFCNVYVISKGKVSSVRSAIRPAPFASPLLDQIESYSNNSDRISDTRSLQSQSMRDMTLSKPWISVDEIRSPFMRPGRGSSFRPFSEIFDSDTDISFVSSSRTTTDRASSIALDFTDLGQTPRLSTSSATSIRSSCSGLKFTDLSSPQDFSFASHDSDRTSCSASSQGMQEDLEAEMRRLKLELKQTMEMYSKACREALNAKRKAMEIHRWRTDEENLLEDAKSSEETALSVAERERSRCKAAGEEVEAEAGRKFAELESRKRVTVDSKAYKEMEEMKRVMDSLIRYDIRCRRYSIDEIEEATENFAESRKIGGGGYGPVYKCYMEHTPVAVKVLRADAAQGRSQFQREVEVLSLIRHPNMVLLLGACPEYGILVYEYMARGSLDNCLFHRGKSPVLSWQLRFRIAAEIATGLLFLHQTKPEPLVHRDLKPGNILLDSNYVSKIGDVGLARLVPAISGNATQCHITSTAGTFCYIDPEYQQTGMLSTKSDVYSLGIILLQIVTAKPPMGLIHHVEDATKNGTFKDVLDPAVPDWPEAEALSLAKIGLKCAELRRKDRPDLSKVVLPELNRLRELAEESMRQLYFVGGGGGPSPLPSHASISQEVMSDPQVAAPSSTSQAR